VRRAPAHGPKAWTAVGPCFPLVTARQRLKERVSLVVHLTSNQRKPKPSAPANQRSRPGSVALCNAPGTYVLQARPIRSRLVSLPALLGKPSPESFPSDLECQRGSNLKLILMLVKSTLVARCYEFDVSLASCENVLSCGSEERIRNTNLNVEADPTRFGANAALFGRARH